MATDAFENTAKTFSSFIKKLKKNYYEFNI